MAGQYAPLPFSYISAGIKAPKTGLRKDDGIYGTNEHVIRDVSSNNDLSQTTFEVHDNGAFTSNASLEEPGVTVNPLYGAHVLHHAAAGGLPRQTKLQPELPHNKLPPTSENDYRQAHSGSENQTKPDQTYGNWQDHGLNVYNGPRNAQPQVTYGRPQQSNNNTQNSSSDVNANLPKNIRITSYPPNTDSDGFSYDSVPRTLAPMAPGASSGVGVYQTSQHSQPSVQRSDTFSNYVLKPDANSFGVDNTASSHPQYGIAAYPPRQQNQIPKHVVGNQAGTSQAVFVANPAGNEGPKQSDFAFERPDFALYAGNNAPRTSETTSSPTDVHNGVSYPLQPIKSSVTTSPPPPNRAKRERDESGCCGGCCSRTACIVVAIVLTALVCLGAGFVAGWFGRQAALGDSSSTSGSNSYSTTTYLRSSTSTLNGALGGATKTTTTTQGRLVEPTSPAVAQITMISSAATMAETTTTVTTTTTTTPTTSTSTRTTTSPTTTTTPAATSKEISSSTSPTTPTTTTSR